MAKTASNLLRPRLQVVMDTNGVFPERLETIPLSKGEAKQMVTEKRKRDEAEAITHVAGTAASGSIFGQTYNT